jgi:hypothetical protein
MNPPEPSSDLSGTLPGTGLRLDFKPSLPLRLACVLLLILCFYALYVAQIPLSVKILFALVSLLLVIFRFSRILLVNHPYAIQSLVLTEKQWFFLQLNNQQIFTATIRNDSLLTGKLVIIRFKLCQHPGWWKAWHYPEAIIIHAAMVNEQSFRALKRYLRLLKLPEPEHPV